MIVDTQTLLETERLKLIVPNASLADPMADFLIRNREHFKTSFFSCDEYYQAGFWRQAFQNMQANFEKRHSLYLVLMSHKEPEKIIGNIVFDGVIRGPLQSCYVGYKIDKNYAGQGLMVEALKPSIDIIFNDWALHRIMGNHRPENKESAAILNKLGFVTEGEAKNYMYINGAWCDHVLTALINPNNK